MTLLVLPLFLLSAGRSDLVEVTAVVSSSMNRVPGVTAKRDARRTRIFVDVEQTSSHGYQIIECSGHRFLVHDGFMGYSLIAKRREEARMLANSRIEEGNLILDDLSSELRNSLISRLPQNARDSIQSQRGLVGQVQPQYLIKVIRDGKEYNLLLKRSNFDSEFRKKGLNAESTVQAKSDNSAVDEPIRGEGSASFIVSWNDEGLLPSKRSMLLADLMKSWTDNCQTTEAELNQHVRALLDLLMTSSKLPKPAELDSVRSFEDLPDEFRKVLAANPMGYCIGDRPSDNEGFWKGARIVGVTESLVMTVAIPKATQPQFKLPGPGWAIDMTIFNLPIG